MQSFNCICRALLSALIFHLGVASKHSRKLFTGFENHPVNNKYPQIDSKREICTATDGFWNFNETERRWRFDVRDCKLHRFSAADARQCLDQRHVLLIGDSVTRLQYLSLMYFVENGIYPDPFQFTTEVSKYRLKSAPPGGTDFEVVTVRHPNIATEHVMKDWYSAMHNVSDAILDSGEEACDCYREGPWQKYEDFYENRYYSLRSTTNDALFDKPRRPPYHINLTFIFDTCITKVKGNYPLHPSRGTALQRWSPHYDWKGDWSEIVKAWESTGHHMGADAVQISCGAWPYMIEGDSWPLKGSETFINEVAASLPGLLKRHSKRPFEKFATRHSRSSSSGDHRALPIIWRTNTPFKGRFINYSTAQTAMRGHNYSSFDYYAMIGALSDNFRLGNWTNGDLIHPLPWVIEEMNNYLLNMLC